MDTSTRQEAGVDFTTKSFITEVSTWGVKVTATVQQGQAGGSSLQQESGTSESES